MAASRHRGKIVAGALVLLCFAVAVEIAFVRWIRKSRQSVRHTNMQTNEARAAAPPRGPRAVLSTIPVLSFDEKRGAQENVDHLGYWDAQTWVRYKDVDFGTGVSSVVTVVSCGRRFEGRFVFLHLDAQNGPVIAEVQLPVTQGFEAVAAPVHDATGIHDVFITCSDGGFNLQSIKFVRPQSATNLIPATSYSAFSGIKEPRPGIVGHTDDGDWIKYDQIDFGRGVSSVAVDLAMGPKEAKVEFHLDASNAPPIATLIPISTGSWTTFQIQEAPVQGGGSGVHDLYLTFHGGRGLPDIRAIRFKADK